MRKQEKNLQISTADLNLCIIIILAVILLLPGCSSKTPISVPGKQPVPFPTKKTPDSSRIPPTQRPYQIDGKTYYPLPSSHGYSEKGIASWYGRKFHGRKTSNGETYNMYARTAAHKTLPMNTHVLVKNMENGREMTLRVNDRGPFVKGRIIDLSLTAAQELGVVKNGTAKVEVTALGEAVTYVEGSKKIERFLPHEDFQKGEFYIQIGSFTNKTNALNLAAKMEQQGQKAVIVNYDRGDALFYRVQVYAGVQLSLADEFEKNMEASGFSEAFVVAR